MNLSEILDKVRAAGISPIVVETVHDDNSDIHPVGPLQSYLDALKVLGVSAVLVETFQFTEDYFFYADEEAEEEEEEADRRDLRATERRLRAYEPHIGEIGFIQIWAPSSHGNLLHEIEDDWWVSFHELAAATRDSIDSQSHEKIERLDAEEEIQWKEVRSRLSTLVDDESFQKLKSQKAMLAYAMEQYPDLEEWDLGALKQEVQALAAKVEVRKTRGGSPK